MNSDFLWYPESQFVNIQNSSHGNPMGKTPGIFRVVSLEFQPLVGVFL